MKQETWEEWKDVLGQTYRPGDIVCVSVINDRSPQQVIGEVIQINKTDSKGEQIVDGVWKNGQWLGIASCSVKIRPRIDSRGFYRSEKLNPKDVTYRIPTNIIKLPFTLDDIDALT